MATNELRTDLRITGENAVKRGLKDVGDEADKTGDKLEGLSKDTDHLAESLGDAEKQYHDLIKAFQETGDLDKKALGKAKREMRFFEGLKKELETDLHDPLARLGEQAAKTGFRLDGLAASTTFLRKQAHEAEAKIEALVKALNATGDLQLVKSIREARHELSLLNQMKAELEHMLLPSGGGFLADIFGDGLAKNLGAAISKAGPVAIGALVAIAVASAPFIGGVVASAVVGAAGAGGIAGGLALAAQDSRVKQAAEDLAGTAKTAFELAGQEMVLPAIDALGELERASQDIAVKLGHGFAAIAPTVKPLTEGLIGFADEFVDDLVVAMEDAKPVIRAIANELPEIGDALGDFFTIISEDPQGAAMAFKNLSMIIQSTLRTTGHVIATLSDIYVWSVRAGGAAAGFLEDTLGWLPIIGDWFTSGRLRADHLIEGMEKAGDASNDFAGGLSRVANAAEDAEKEIQDLKDATNDLFGVTMELDQAVLAYKQNLVDSRKELAEGTRTLDLNTQAGRDNMETALGRIGVIENLRDAEAESTLGIVEANKRYAERLEALKKDLLQLGYNKKAVDELIARYLAVPNAINVQLNLKLGGDAQAWSAFRALERQTVPTTSTGPGGFVSTLDGRASGGPTRAGRTYVVGENGPELWTEGANGFVTPAAQTAAIMSGASGGSAQQPVFNLSLAPGGASGLEAAIWAWLASQLRVDGGVIGQFRIPRNT